MQQFENLFITGKTGVGKTYLARQILQNAVMEFDKNIEPFSSYKGKDAFKIYKCSELMFLARKPSTGEQLYHECINARGLVLDDLGVGKRSDYIPDIIYIVIDNRLDKNRPTIVTSNLTLEEISDSIDDRLSSRLASFKQLLLKGNDRRVKSDIA